MIMDVIVMAVCLVWTKQWYIFAKLWVWTTHFSSHLNLGGLPTNQNNEMRIEI